MKKIILLLVILIATPSWAATYYVDTVAGDDARSCSTAQNISTPKKTIYGILNGCMFSSTPQAGNTLYIRGGTYEESGYTAINNNSATSWTNAVTISAYPGEQVIWKPNPTNPTNALTLSYAQTKYVIVKDIIFDGDQKNTSNLVSVAYDGPIANKNSANHIRFQNCTFRNSKESCFYANPTCDYNELIKCTFYNNGISNHFHHAIYISSNNNYVNGCTIRNNAAWGIHQYPSGNNNRFYYNKIFDNGSGGIIVVGGSGNKAYQNTIYRNGFLDNADAICSYVNSVGTIIDGNTVYENKYGIRTDPTAQGTIIKNNKSYRNEGGNLLDYGIGTIFNDNLCGCP